MPTIGYDQIARELFQELFGEAESPKREKLLGFLSKTAIADATANPSAWASATSTSFSAVVLKRSLAAHAMALTQAAQASEKYARSLRTATWVLAGATIVLSLTTLAAALRIL